MMGNGRRQLTLISDVSRILESEVPKIGEYAVRSIVPGDKPALAELYHASFSRDLVAGMDDANKEMEQAFRGEFGVLDTEASLVVTDGERLLGSILTVEEAPWPDTPPGPFIIDLFIHPDTRRRGLAHYLIAAAARELARKGKATAALRVLSENTGALRLYKRLGFRPAEES
jgi:ribosomal protein S18 acetylase RimI-like enzyme